MTRGEAVDIKVVHLDLWKRSDRLNRLKVIQKELADEYGCTKYTMCRVFARMEDEGRIKKLQGHRGNMWTYTIKDPKRFC